MMFAEMRVSPRVPDVVTQALNAMNAGDTDGLMRCLSPRGGVDAFGMLFLGLAEVREWCEGWIVARGIRFTDRISIANGSWVSLRAQMSGSAYIGGVTMDFETLDGTIALLRLSR